MTGLPAKIALAALALSWAAFSLFVGEAAGANAGAPTIIRNLRSAPSDAARLQMIDLATQRIETSWARPVRWHAGATETLAGLYALRYDLDNDPEALTQSARWTVATLTQNDIQPRAWTRLAHLGLARIPNALCEPHECIARSFETGRMLDSESSCGRLRIAGALEPMTLQDQRVQDFLLVASSRRQIARCLSFLPSNQLFQAVLSKPH